MIIKCPECGHEVSDKAAICPHCGVKIAGNPDLTSSATKKAPKSNSNKGIYIVAFIIALAICGVCGYFYMNAKNDDEAAAYRTAMQSESVESLQAYLEEFRDAPREHRDSIQARISSINQMNREWNDVLVSNSRAALQHYLDAHPDSPFQRTALHKIDSLDWVSASSAATVEAIKSYIDRHPNGDYVDEANERVRNINASTVQPEERQIVASIFRNFFQGINSKDEDRLTSTVNSLLTTFLGKHDATKSDVIMFMNKLWKDDVQNLNWHILDDYKIDKKEVGDGEYEFSVTFSATQDVQKTTGNTSNAYRIRAKVNPDGKITEMSMSKVLE